MVFYNGTMVAQLRERQISKVPFNKNYNQHTKLIVEQYERHNFNSGATEVFMQLPIKHFKLGLMGKNGGVGIM